MNIGSIELVSANKWKSRCVKFRMRTNYQCEIVEKENTKSASYLLFITRVVDL